MDLHDMYVGARARIVSLLEGLPDEKIERPVAATPGWTVKDVAAHLTGVAADTLDNRLDGVATDPWTARQVAERKDRTLGEILAEWDELAPRFAPLVGAHRSLDLAAYDALIHEHDLRGSLGLAGSSDPAAVDLILSALMPALGGRIDQAGRGALRVVAEDVELVAGTTEVAATVTASPVELFRSLTGRRSDSQVHSYDWDGEPSRFIELWSFFGPLPAIDVREAGAP